MQRLITSYKGGRNGNIQNVMRHELMPVPISIVETDGSLRTGTKSTLATLLTNPFVCPETIVVPLVSSCLLIDGVALVSHILFVLHIHDLLLVSLTVITNHNTLRRSHFVNSGVTSAHLDLVNITDTTLSPK